MKTLPLHPNDIARVYEGWPGSNAQKLFHNRLLERLEEKRTKLENATPETLLRIQGEIAELRGVLGLIHEKDSPNLKALYG